MRESLTVQANLAPAFVGQAWPALLDQARLHLAGRQETVSTLLVCGCGDSHFAAQGTEFGLKLWTGRRVRAASSMQAGRYLLEAADAGAKPAKIPIVPEMTIARIMFPAVRYIPRVKK